MHGGLYYAGKYPAGALHVAMVLGWTVNDGNVYVTCADVTVTAEGSPEEGDPDTGGDRTAQMAQQVAGIKAVAATTTTTAIRGRLGWNCCYPILRWRTRWFHHNLRSEGLDPRRFAWCWLRVK